MTHDTPLIAMLVAGFGLAFLFGLMAQRLKLPLIAGYLLAGVVIGPFTPGYVADTEIAGELAEIGVILLMFGVGLHFAPRDLMAVSGIALPGALGQIAVATLFGMGIGWGMGWTLGAGLIFGIALSVASTVVLLRALQDRELIQTDKGRVAVGWLIVEDLVMVLALVLIPPLAGLLGGKAMPVGEDAEMVAEVTRSIGIGPIAATVVITLVKAAAFVALMLVIGRRVIPWILHFVAHTLSRELFRLAVLAIALGVAYGATHFFGVSFALGAFFAGMVMSSSTLSQQAMRETLPLRDAFAVLFFVSVGMLFNPAILVSQPLALLATVTIIVGVKAAAGFYLVRLLGEGRDMALTIAASLAQIGEFSFILITMGTTLYIVPPEARDLVVAGAMLSILANPLLFHLLDRREARKAAAPRSPSAPPRADPARSAAGNDEPSAELRPDARSEAAEVRPSVPPPGG
ncbi:cation:proton antiporter domain-containing protein [Rhodobacter calidifons]|uniref:Sodium:proton antiporter n=1 Tax=Rhodobacter calidifons TaxID=2715277 RepID=A0ABX0G5P1_9RHOB|nr:cation:proton antiporter [Rhodobacter calidifons]NHB76444.1 sodium:proton antiporter [Rhodobacter calidifons]